MHISGFPHTNNNTILTKCSKMTEETKRRYGMNGNADGSPNHKDDCPKTNCSQGGRLKFFKDGKFILELERAREGERVSWVSVPRKTFWPPQGIAASTPSYRQESSTSLSDDNSSIQSSPWQRDHSWKQASPHRNLSKELTFYYYVPKRARVRSTAIAVKSRKRRQPYSISEHETENKVLLCNLKNIKDTVCNIIKKTTATAASTPTTVVKRRTPLEVIVENLKNNKSTTSTPPRAEMVVSPRKRFLREMEKDKVLVEDNSCQKRSRNKTPSNPISNQVHVPPPITTIQSSKSVSSSPVRVNGTNTMTEDVVLQQKPAATAQQTNQKNCSYSITALLADDRNTRRSPSSSPSHYPHAPTVAQPPQYCSPSSEDRWYTDSVDKMRSINLSQQADKRGFPGSGAGFPPPHSLIHSPYLYQYSLPPFYGPSLYGRNYMIPPMYSPHMQVPLRHDVPTCSWAGEPLGPRDTTEHRDDNITDMPLNLSKHAG